MINHLLAITLAYLLDRFIGDPTSVPHPVRMIGKGITRLEQLLNRGNMKRVNGLILLMLIVTIAFGLAYVIVYYSYHIHLVVGIGIEAILIATTIATKGLADAAYDVYKPLVNKDHDRAREKLSHIVGRDTEQLSESDIVRATVETVAENTSDGITAPLFWALIGGAPLALAYRAINTCDSMIGYRNERYIEFGWASARIDDLANLIPSRITGYLMVIVNKPVRPQTRRDCFRILIRDARQHVSPNSGWLEAATAGLLGVQLGGATTYNGIVSERATVGESVVPLHVDDIPKAVSIMHRTVMATILLFWLGGGVIAFTRTWFESAASI